MPFWEVYPDREQEDEEKARFTQLAPPPADGSLGAFAPADIIVPGHPPRRLHWSATPHRSATGETQAILLIGSLLPIAEPKVSTPDQPATDDSMSAAPGGNLARHVPIGLVTLDREGVVTDANDAVGALLGRPLAVGDAFEPWLAASAPEAVLRDPVLREWRDNVWRRQMSRAFSLASADGLLKEIELRPRLLPAGHLLLMLSDVTESRRAEDALRTSEAKYRGLFRELPTGIALADRTGALVEGNPALEKLSGFSRADLRRLRLEDLVCFDAGTSSPNDQARPASLITRDGSRQPVVVSQGSLCNTAGEAVLQACFFLPRPTPQTSEQPAPAHVPPAPTSDDPRHQWRDLAFENARTAILVTDLRGRIRAANPAAARFFATDPSALEGVALYRLFRPEDPAGFSREVSSQLNSAKSWNRETPFHTHEGRPAGTCRAEITPVNTPGASGLLCLLQPVFNPVATP
jgi:PAS domain S-box-containing protein